MTEPVVISSPREPVAVTVLSGFLLFCLLSLAIYDKISTGALREFPKPSGQLFLLVLGVGCALYLAAAYVDTPAAVLRLERPSWILLSALFLIYGSWSLYLVGPHAVAFCIVLFSLVVAGQWRLWRIRKWRRILRARAEVVQ